MTDVLLALLGGYAAAGVLMAGLQLVYTVPALHGLLVAPDPRRATKGWRLARDAVVNSTLSVSLFTVTCVGLREVLFHTGEVGWARLGAEVVGVLLIYDFLYYGMHRFLFHGWKPLIVVHAVHHTARNPRSIDSLVLHPVETVMGILLFLGTIAMVGGIHLQSFAVAFVIYTSLNVVNHAGVVLPGPLFRPLASLTRKHDRHHHTMRSGNYSTLTPLPDLLFGTVA
ncbi:MAG: sterol desaturase family protein [Alphaproteobacteria bacterium]|nr:sterol desaturase family protein [Alphaproteobacteria bacterium]